MAAPKPDNIDQRLAEALAMLESVPDPVLMVAPDGTVRDANRAARALFPALRTGEPLSYGLRAPEILAAVAAASPGTTTAIEYTIRVPVPRAFDVQVTTLSSGGVILFLRDLTEARRIERLRVDFIANVSHELRTPLASLVGFIQTLQGAARNDMAARERFLDIMQGQAARMTRLIDDLLSLSRIELREHVAPSTSVDLRSVAAQMIEALATLARQRGVDIVLAGDAPVMVLGDFDELMRMVENLVENAVKYGESGKRVDVSVIQRHDEAELAVRDYGPGIAAEHLPRLTERFYRVDVAESREKGGTGLGLAIVKHIVNRHRGRLDVESIPGQGAVFRVTLRAAPVRR